MYWKCSVERYLSLIFVLPLILCSCSSESVLTSRVTGEVVDISQFEQVNESNETNETGLNESVDLGEVSFVQDGRVISGIYEDGTHYIEYDVEYHDYGTDEVAIFSADYEPNASQWLYDTPNGYDKVELRPLHMKNLNQYASRAVFNSATDTINSLQIEHYDSSLFESLDVDLFPYCLSYCYDVEAIDNQNLIEEISFDNQMYPDVTSYKEYTYRQQIGGLPLGVPAINRVSKIRCNYGPYYGSIFGVNDVMFSSYYSNSNRVYNDLIYYDLSNIEVVESHLSVISLSECIDNSVNGILELEQMNCCLYGNAYYAELVYIPFSVGCESFSDFDFEVKVVPVWAIYVLLGRDGQQMQAATVFLNATTGVLL